MAMYPITEEEIQEEFSGIRKIPEQKYDKFSELKYSEIKNNEPIVKEIIEEAYKRRAIIWMIDENDNDLEKYLKYYKRIVEKALNKSGQRLSYRITRNMENDESNVAKDILRGFMQNMYDLCKNYNFPYYMRHIDRVTGTDCELTSKPEVYDYEPEEVPNEMIDDGLKTKQSFWMPESIRRKLEILSKAVDSTVFMFIASSITNTIKEFFIRLTGEQIEEFEEKAKNKTEELMKKYGVQSKRK